jgi:hypothetical protein
MVVIEIGGGDDLMQVAVLWEIPSVHHSGELQG